MATREEQIAALERLTPTQRQEVEDWLAAREAAELAPKLIEGGIYLYGDRRETPNGIQETRLRVRIIKDLSHAIPPQYVVRVVEAFESRNLVAGDQWVWIVGVGTMTPE